MIFRGRPGGIVDCENVSEFKSLISFYDASFITNLKAHTPFAGGYLRQRQIFQYDVAKKAYEGHIHTATEKLLTWQPMAVMITFIALVVAIAVWVIR